MRIATIGAGAMAEALGAGWTEAGHEVLVTARSPQRAATLAARLGGRAAAGNLREAAAFGEVILLAVPGEAATDALTAAGAADGAFARRPLIDCTNAFAADAFTAAPNSFTLAMCTVAERVAKVAVDARVVKAFSMLAAEIWRGGERSYDARPLTVPLCGDDPDALATVGKLVRDLGCHPVDAGGLDRAQYVEAMTAFVMGLWFAGHDARATLPPLESAFAHPD
ncbi:MULTISPECIES: NADPH-dependent F420 reductase [Pseudofrankia]|uniref:NADPH-dependent F420 reductase n=1 Tax=Pseudofrankia TaxID=2994363 RepID=UPI000234B4D5|nr:MULTISPECIES: NAD(P)-binding domain-containing protein [Pseudofrankia]OHV30410.1 NADP oxidoreductase [Pseudofrankia sp. EUN1h]